MTNKSKNPNIYCSKIVNAHKGICDTNYLQVTKFLNEGTYTSKQYLTCLSPYIKDYKHGSLWSDLIKNTNRSAF